jgi:hypothetical protein
MSPEDLPPPDECANCGARIPPRAKACPECGADERTGWRETSVYDSLDLPDEAWRDGSDPPRSMLRARKRINGVSWYWWCVGALVLALFIAGLLGLR